MTLSAASHGIGPSALLDTLVALVPSPAQRAAFPAKTVGGEAVALTADPAGPLAALVFKTLSDPFTGKITILRVVSGTLNGDSTVYNSRAEENERLGHLMLLQGKQGSPAPKLDRRRHRRRGQAQAHRHRRHPLRQGPAAPARLDPRWPSLP